MIASLLVFEGAPLPHACILAGVLGGPVARRGGTTVYFRAVRCPLRATGAFRGQGRVVPRGAPGPVGSEGSRDVRNETGKTVPRCFAKFV